MMKIRNYIVLITLCIGSILEVAAQKWTTHFAYNNVTQIAMAPDEVYAISDGSLFSVNKRSEQITKYDRQSGLNGTNIQCIHYDEVGNQLIIAYANGKIDILTSAGVRYISDLYDKDMTQRKDIYNVTIQGRTAYLSTHYGIQTMDLRDCSLVDSYWLRPNGEETPIKDVLIKGDSIYAFLYKDKDTGKKDSLFCAALHDNLEDYTAWKRESGNRISPDANKGKIYAEENITWYAGDAYPEDLNGVVCVSLDTTISYKPQGPLQNNPYSMTTYGTELWVVPGGRWASQYNNPGVVMHYNGSQWTNIDATTIKAKTGNPTLDFMNVAVDQRNPNHYFVTSYGTGLYEFDHDTLVRQYLPDTINKIVARIESNPKQYTRLDNAEYDTDNNLWFLSAATHSQLHCLDATGVWYALSLVYEGNKLNVVTPGGLIIDMQNPNYKWIALARYNTCICVYDDNGTRFDDSDDRLIHRDTWITQSGQTFRPNNIYCMRQDTQGRVWICTDFGLAYFSGSTQFIESEEIIQPAILDDNGDNPLTTQEVSAICEDSHGRLWVGTQTLGVYVLSNDAKELVAHYTPENSSIPSNNILSLACDASGKVYIGSSEGIACYDEKASPPEGESIRDEEEELDMGHMQQWRLHYSYRSPSEIAIAPNRIYANSNGALFSLDLKTEEIEYWSKSTGLTGSVIRHIAYDENTKQLIIGYDDGRVDLLADDGSVRQMPDLTLKASSIPVTINAISIGSRYVYLSMPFGVIALNARKAEIAETYYIGEEASAVDVLQVIEKEDSLFVFTSELVYSASLKDELANYAYWHKNYLPTSGLQQAVLHQNKIYTLQHDSLYRREQNQWSIVGPKAIQWIHELNNRLLVYTTGNGLYHLTDDDQFTLITRKYTLNDACYSNGTYWLAQANSGLIRVNPNGDDYFNPDGPNCNYGYSMYTAHDQIYVAAGGRWASEYGRRAYINIYNGSEWLGIASENIKEVIGKSASDLVSIAVDPNDAGHFFAASYGRGVYEFQNYQALQRYSTNNSTLREASSGISTEYYTRTDGAMMDKDGNLWVLNPTSVGLPLHVMTPDKIWHGLSLRSNNTNISFITPTGIWIDRRNYQRKWMLDQRYKPGVILLDDRGTPTISSDDRCIKREIFVDQNGNMIQPSTFRSWVQDYSNRIWIGTEKGIILIPSSVDFFTSNSCRRIIIPRNDGTGLGDYLLGEEQINCMAVDGGNRMWIGTQNSGLYLIEDDTITVAHFTERNSLLPSNTILSIAILPTTGEVFVGTEQGIASYRSDASEPKTDLSQAYAFPNPVRPDYGGMISIAGLMENTTVNIIDASGNLVCKTRSHGGLAVWDGNDAYGHRATAGVYTALCNTEGGHVVVKILVIR